MTTVLDTLYETNIIIVIMNDTLIFQVPMSRKLRDAARLAAKEQGFSSLQEYVRVMVSKLSRKEINLHVHAPVQLSPRAIKRYNRMAKEIEDGKNIIRTKNLDELFAVLHS